MGIVQKNNEPLVTVITVVYNDVKNIEREILSVLNQTYRNIEFIIIDGGSTDGTVDVIKKYDKQIAFCISEKDAGIADAMNKGIDHATGEWVNFLNSDDYYISNTIISEIFSDKIHEADNIYGSFVGNFNGESVLCVAHSTMTDKAWEGMRACHSTIFTRLQFLKRFKFNIKYRVSADNEFITRCVAEGCTFERFDGVIFRVGTVGNSASNWLKARMENWEIGRKYFPGLRTDWFHFQALCKEILFRIVKAFLSLFGIYQLVRYLYRIYLKKKFPLLPKGSAPFNG